jgi:hypothetical protein
MRQDTKFVEEKRQRKRVSLSMSVQIVLGGTTFAGRCLNVSMSGMLVQVQNQELALSLALGLVGSFVLETWCGDDRLSVSGEGRVVRVQALKSAQEMIELGLQFDHLDMENSINLYRLIKCQEVV